MVHTEPELERVIAAARGIPVPPPSIPDAALTRRLASAALWLRFWHERERAAQDIRPDRPAG
jgi:hypothetical protein